MSKHHERTWIILIGLIVLLAAVAVGCITALVMSRPDEVTQPPTETDGATVGRAESVPTSEETTVELTETVTEEVTEQIPENTTEPEQWSVEEQPAALTAMLEENQTTYEDLAQLDCTQLVVVVSDGTSAQIGFFSCTDGLWQELPELASRGHVGRSGVYADKREGDGSTPAGLYGIGSAFYINKMPDTALDVFQITRNTYWVDDPDSAFYNQRVEGLEHKDWNSAERMIGYDVYRYGFVVNYNLMAEYQKGSAIFFHIGDHPTAGCIATDESMVLAYLAELDQARNPHILILRGDGLEG